jgi:hypothetical protein
MLAPQCGVETGKIELPERPNVSARIIVYCVPGTGVIALDKSFGLQWPVVLLISGWLFVYAARLLFRTLFYGWRPKFEEPKSV